MLIDDRQTDCFTPCCTCAHGVIKFVSLFAPVKLIVNTVCVNYIFHVMKLKADGTAKGNIPLRFSTKRKCYLLLNLKLCALPLIWLIEIKFNTTFI